jgi:hypothetical protein
LPACAKCQISDTQSFTTPRIGSHCLIAARTCFGRFIRAFSVLTVILLVAAVPRSRAQATADSDLPDAPQSQTQTAPAPQTQPQSQPQSTSQPNTPQPDAQSSSSSATQQTAGPETKEEQQKRAQEELQKEEKQRILGVVPMFNVTSNHASAPLSAKQKFQLMFKSSTDPWIFFLTAADGGISMAGDEYKAYGQGVEGFAKYWGAAYADTFDGNFWGNAVLPAWWHEDPRYFRMGHGNFFKRAGYSASTTVWCKRDSGKWGPNYANVAGNFIAGGISNLYYPANDRGVELSFARGASVTYEGIVGAELAEFWPDIYQHFLNNYRKKKARKAAQESGDGL